MSTLNNSLPTPSTGSGPPSSTSTQSTVATTTVSKGYKSRHEVPPLSDDGSDYGQWSFCTQLILESRDLWKIVNGTTSKPDETTDPTGHSEWSQKDRDAKIQIALSLKQGPFNTIASATTAKECWDKLADRFRGKGEQRVAYLMEELFHSAVSEAESLEPQINKLLQAARNLDSLGFGLADKVLAFVIVMALPETMSTLKTILYNNRGTDLTSDGIVHQILIDEQRRIRASGLAATAFYAKVAKGGKPKPKSDKHCTHCDIRGHDVSECRKFKKQQETKAMTGPKKLKALPSNSAHVAATHSDSDADGSDKETIHILRVAIVPEEPALLTSNTALMSDALIDKWIVDSGASRTMCSHRDWFQSFTPFTKPSQVVLGDSSSIPALGTGHVHVRVPAGTKWNKLVLHDVLYVPELHGNLLSVPQIVRYGAEVHFKGQECKVFNDAGLLIGEGSLQGNLFTICANVVNPPTTRIALFSTFPCEGEDVPPAALSARTTSAASLATWHRRLGHLATDSVTQMVRRGLVKGMEIEGGHSTKTPCEPCLKGKQTRSDIPRSSETRTQTILGRVFSDVCGKMSTRSHDGFEYFVTWTDDASRKVYVTGLRAKSDVLQALKHFVSEAELETGHRVKILRSDGGGEYTAHSVSNFLADKGIKHELTTPHTPQQNGVAERMNRTLLDKVRAMLIDADLPESYWYDALLHAALLHNVSPTRSLENKTPEEAWSGNKPDISRLRVFGCKAFVHIPDHLRPKLGSKSLVCTHLGYASQHKAYRLVHRPTRRFLTSHDVVFDEGGETPLIERVIIETESEQKANAHAEVNVEPEEEDEPPALVDVEDDDDDDEETQPPPAPKTHDQTPPSPNVLSRPKRETRPPIRYGQTRPSVEHASVAHTGPSTDPRTYAEAMARPDAADWELACEDERRAFERMGVYEVVPRPDNRKVVGSKWVFRIKRGPDGEIVKYKARVVAQGFSQIEGIDYDETFAPVAKFPSLRAILAIAAERDLEVHQMDVKSAYLNGELREEIFMEAPPGFDVPEGMVLRLVKAVYGTKQGGRVWYEEIRETLRAMGYQRTDADHAVFVRNEGENVPPSLIALYVDDITMAAKYPETIKRDKEALKARYQMTDLGEITWILGMHVTRDRKAGWIALSQENYIEDMLRRFGKSNSRPINTPSLANEHLNKLKSPEAEVKPYQRAIGSLMYPMLGTRPDLAFTVASLGRHAATPGEEHCRALERAFRYLRATSDWKLVFQQGVANGLVLHGYADADWASDTSDRKSTSGYVFLLAGGAVSWSSKKQSSVALSSTEAEYIAGAHAAKEVVWLRRLLSELGLTSDNSTTLLMDNQSAMTIARNPEFHDRTKHIEVRYHFLRVKVENGELELEYVPTGEQVADILTKGLGREKHLKFSEGMGIRR